MVDIEVPYSSCSLADPGLDLVEQQAWLPGYVFRPSPLVSDSPRAFRAHPPVHTADRK